MGFCIGMWFEDSGIFSWVSLIWRIELQNVQECDATEAKY